MPKIQTMPPAIHNENLGIFIVMINKGILCAQNSVAAHCIAAPNAKKRDTFASAYRGVWHTLGIEWSKYTLMA